MSAPGRLRDRDRRPSPRDPRRTWLRLLPPPRSFTSAAGRELAEWAAAIEHLETYETWTAAHPDGPPL